MIQKTLHDAKLLVFDLDGTLYEGQEHFNIYAKFIKCLLNPKQQTEFTNIYDSIVAGNHPLKIGKVYDAKEDLIWNWDPFTEALSDASNWNKKSVQLDDVPNKLLASDFDYQRWVPIGDGWWPPYVIGRHFGLNNDQLFKAYNDTKDEMSLKDKFINPTPGLRELLFHLSTSTTMILMTDSFDSDADRILSKLNLSSVFEERITSAGKPVKTNEHLHYLLDKYQCEPDNAVSIGDNFMNEIAPALQIGMKAIWLSPEKESVHYPNLQIVKTLANL